MWRTSENILELLPILELFHILKYLNKDYEKSDSFGKYFFENMYLGGLFEINLINAFAFVFIFYSLFFTEKAVSKKIENLKNGPKAPGDPGSDDTFKEWLKYIVKIVLIATVVGCAMYFTYSLFFAYNMFYVENTLKLFLHDAEIPGIEGKGYFQILNEVIPKINAVLDNPNNGLSSEQLALLDRYKTYCIEFNQTIGTSNSFDMSKLMKCVFFVEEEKLSGSLVKLYKALNETTS